MLELFETDLSNVSGDSDTTDVLMAGTNEVPSGYKLKDDIDIVAQMRLAGLTGILSNPNITSGDIDGDGDLDFIFSTNHFFGFYPDYSPSIFKLINNGDGTFSNLERIQMPNVQDPVRDIKLGDVDNDGDLDLFWIGNGNKAMLHVGINDANGNFIDSGFALSSSVFPGSIELFDSNGDGYEDVIIRGVSESRHELFVFQNNGDINPAFTETFWVGETRENTVSNNSNNFDIKIGNINNDNRPDFIINQNYPDAGKVYKNNVDGTYEELRLPYATIGDSNTLTSISTGNITPDNLSEIFSMSYENKFSSGSSANKFEILFNSLTTGLSLQEYTLGDNVYLRGQDVILEDLNSDGYTDIFVSKTISSNELNTGYILWGDSENSYSNFSRFASSEIPASKQGNIFLGNVDIDKEKEIISFDNDYHLRIYDRDPVSINSFYLPLITR